MSDVNERIVQLAGEWIGTPYRHQGYQKHIGCDCLGLIRGIWHELYGIKPDDPQPYAMDWAEASKEERMLNAARAYCGPEIALENMEAGCLILFRWRQSASIKHAGILSAPYQFIHAFERIGVTQSALVPSWRRRIAAVFKFPNISQ